MATSDYTGVPAAMLAEIDQEQAKVRELVAHIVDHWDGPDGCPGAKVCLGVMSDDINTASVVNPVWVANALQGALGLLANAEYDRRHP